jgi:NADH-quinone oxidoreductase subunit E
MYYQMLTAKIRTMTEKVLTSEDITEIEKVCQHFPLRSAACIEGLKIIQKNHRWVSDDAVKELAELLEMSPAAIDSVATYYSLIFRKPVGRHVIMVCDSVSCWIMGYEKLLVQLKDKLQIGYGETTADDRFTLLSICCLGTCDHAPAIMINEDLHRDLATDQLDAILATYK